jgi:hypothetical protein
MADIISNIAENEQMISAAGFSRRKLVSKPRAYFWHKIVTRMNALPEGKPPSRKEIPKESPKIHKISESGIFRLE